MIKRTTYLAKRSDLSVAEFRAHWRHPHASIAARFRGLAGYTQNHVIERAGDVDPPGFLDGIVELWFDDTAGDAPGRDEDVSAALIDDEPRFLRGLVGATVHPTDRSEPSMNRIWIVGRRDPSSVGGAGFDELTAALARAIAPIEATAAFMQIAAPDTPFTRAALEVHDAPPDVAIVLCVGDATVPRSTLDRLVEVAGAEHTGLAAIEVALAVEERIV